MPVLFVSIILYLVIDCLVGFFHIIRLGQTQIAFNSRRFLTSTKLLSLVFHTGMKPSPFVVTSTSHFLLKLSQSFFAFL